MALVTTKPTALYYQIELTEAQALWLRTLLGQTTGSDFSDLYDALCEHFPDQAEENPLDERIVKDACPDWLID